MNCSIATRKKTKIFRKIFSFGLLALIFGLSIGFLFEDGLKAKLQPLQTTTYVRIDGKSYGTLSGIKEFKDLHVYRQYPNDSFSRVSIERGFVTEPSLYLWAKQSVADRHGLKNIEIAIVNSSNGLPISTFILRGSKPLHWTLEATEPTSGGFHEKLEFAVQEIAIQ